MRWFSLTALVLGGVLVSACTPDYPKCDKDSQCHEREFCVDGLCQQCRPGEVGKNDCGPGKQCKAGRCEAVQGYCNSEADCGGQPCVDHKCTACTGDKDCNGGRCSNGRCIVENRTRCKTNDDCAESEDCLNGFCTPAQRRFQASTEGGPCPLDTVYFDFNESILSAEATGIIDRNAACMKRAAGRTVTLVGHCDPRGTLEYNLALSEKRAQSVRERMTRLGISAQTMQTVPRGKLDATGTDETGWARDRRVDFQWR